MVNRVLCIVYRPSSLLLAIHHTPPHPDEPPTTARKNFSRRRAAFDGEDVTSINERNKNFNKKLKRAFDK